MTKPKATPFPAVNALQDQLWRARHSETRARLSKALRYVKRLYGLPEKPDTSRDLDMKRRESFVRDRHPLVTPKIRDPFRGNVPIMED